MQTVQAYYAAYQHCDQCAAYYVEKYERPAPQPVAEEVDYDDGED